MKLYWEQHEVFFVATLVLFPDKLNGHEVNELFYTPYFIGKDTDFIGLELNEYQKKGYLEYEKSHALYKITKIYTQKATDDLIGYLKSCRQNKLEVLSAVKPPDYEYQQKLVLGAIERAYSQEHQKQPRIKLADIFGNPSDYNYEPPFWELVLALHLLDHMVEIVSMGYDQRKSGLYELGSQPFIEYRITNRKLANQLKDALDATNITPETNPTHKRIQPVTIRSYNANLGTLFFADKEVQIIRQKSRRGKSVGETTQGTAMRKLFKDVNTLSNGVSLRAIVSVAADNFDSKKRKRAKNHLDEINRKIEEETGVPKLINYDQVKYYINRSYLD